MKDQNQNMYVDDKLAAFCKDSNAYSIDASKLSKQLAKDQFLLKTNVSDDIIVLTVCNGILEILTGWERLNPLGFYSISANKFFFVRNPETALVCKESGMELPIHYNPIPIYDMECAFRKAVAEQLVDSIPEPDVDIYDKKTLRIVFPGYFNENNDWTNGEVPFDPEILPCSFQTVIPKNSTAMTEVTKYLTDSEQWAKDACRRFLTHKAPLKETEKAMTDIMNYHYICRKIHAAPDHPWNKAIRLANAMKDKKSVIVRFAKDGETCDFRIRPLALDVDDGKNPDPILFCRDFGAQVGWAENFNPITPEKHPVMCDGKPTGRTCERVADFLGRYFINIQDVDSVFYNKKEIYHG